MNNISKNCKNESKMCVHVLELPMYTCKNKNKNACPFPFSNLVNAKQQMQYAITVQRNMQETVDGKFVLKQKVVTTIFLYTLNPSQRTFISTVHLKQKIVTWHHWLDIIDELH